VDEVPFELNALELFAERDVANRRERSGGTRDTSGL